MRLAVAPARGRLARTVLAAGLLLGACVTGDGDGGNGDGVEEAPAAVPSPTGAPSPAPTVAPTTPSPTASPTAPPTSPPASESATPSRGDVVAVAIERRTSDDATAGFEQQVLDVLTDPRGWVRAGFAFVADPDAEFRIVLAEGDEVDRLCLPYDTYGRYSCQNGPVVALNADRWRSATPSWTGSLDEYRTMLVNHEVGHLLHLHHPRPQCPGEGFPAPVMMQQSTELGACTANPWPLPWEVDLAAERREPLAPPADHDVDDHRPAPPRQQQDTTHRAEGY